MQFPAKETRAAAQLATQFPAEKLTRVAVQGLSVSFQVGLHGLALVRTDGRAGGRSDGSDVITKPNFLALMGLPKSLSYGTPPRVPTVRARAPLKIVFIFFIWNVLFKKPS